MDDSFQNDYRYRIFSNAVYKTENYRLIKAIRFDVDYFY